MERDEVVVDDAELAAAIAETQRLLGPIIVTPLLSGRMLAKPPVKFIHGVFVSVRAATGFGAGLLGEAAGDDDAGGASPGAGDVGFGSGAPGRGSMMRAEHRRREPPPETRAERVRFLVNLIGLVANALGDRSIEARCAPNKILSGEDPRAGNLLLQKLARATALGQDASDRAVALTLETGEVALYQRAIAMRRTLARCQARARGTVIRKLGIIPQKRPETPPPPPVVVLVRDTREQDLADEAVALCLAARDRARDAEAARVAVAAARQLLAELERTRAAQLECARKLAELRAQQEHVRVQEGLLASKALAVDRREARALRLGDRAKHELARLRPLREDLEKRRPPASLEPSGDEAPAAPPAPKRAFRPSGVMQKDGAGLAARPQPESRSPARVSAAPIARKRRPKHAPGGAGVSYAKAARAREKARRSKLERGAADKVRDRSLADVRDGLARPPSPGADMKRAYHALGGQGGIFGKFLRQQLEELKADGAPPPPPSPPGAKPGVPRQADLRRDRARRRLRRGPPSAHEPAPANAMRVVDGGAGSPGGRRGLATPDMLRLILDKTQQAEVEEDVAGEAAETSAPTPRVVDESPAADATPPRSAREVDECPAADEPPEPADEPPEPADEPPEPVDAPPEPKPAARRSGDRARRAPSPEPPPKARRKPDTYARNMLADMLGGGREESGGDAETPAPPRAPAAPSHVPEARATPAPATPPPEPAAAAAAAEECKSPGAASTRSLAASSTGDDDYGDDDFDDFEEESATPGAFDASRRFGVDHGSKPPIDHSMGSFIEGANDEAKFFLAKTKATRGKKNPLLPWALDKYGGEDPEAGDLATRENTKANAEAAREPGDLYQHGDGDVAREEAESGVPRPTLGARMAEAMGYGHKHHGAATSLQASVRHRQASKAAAARRATLTKLGQQSSARFGSAGRPWRDDSDSDGGGFERDDGDDDGDDGGGAAFGFGDSARGALSSPPGVRDDVDADWFGAVAAEPPKPKAPKPRRPRHDDRSVANAGYLNKFDADFDRAMAKSQQLR